MPPKRAAQKAQAEVAAEDAPTRATRSRKVRKLDDAVENAAPEPAPKKKPDNRTNAKKIPDSKKKAEVKEDHDEANGKSSDAEANAKNGKLAIDEDAGQENGGESEDGAVGRKKPKTVKKSEKVDKSVETKKAEKPVETKKAEKPAETKKTETKKAEKAEKPLETKKAEKAGKTAETKKTEKTAEKTEKSTETKKSEKAAEAKKTEKSSEPKKKAEKKTAKPAKSTEAAEKEIPEEGEENPESPDTDVNGASDAKEGQQMGVRKGSWKIVSWNVNGIRAWLPKGGLEFLQQEDADVYCFQETKCSDDKLPKELASLEGYKSYFLAGDKDGYSGVGVLTRKTPINVTFGIGREEHDAEGRVITLEFEKFYLINSYVPNAQRKLVRLDYRMEWDDDFRKYLCDLKTKKSVILTGDLNVAHNEIDLKNPKTNRRNAGFTDEERDGLTTLLKKGFVDSYRKLYPDVEGAYTFWTYMSNARAKNVGWRLDYFIVSDDFVDEVVDNEIRKEVMGSDHCPIVLHLK